MSAKYPDGTYTESVEQEQLALARRVYTLKKLHDDNAELRRKLNELQTAWDIVQDVIFEVIGHSTNSPETGCQVVVKKYYDALVTAHDATRHTAISLEEFLERR